MTDQVDSEPLDLELEDESDRYHRQSLISWWDQDRLRDAKVLVVGAGALGNELVKNLVMMGIGTIVLIDMDTIENSNLARCVFFRPDDDGREKAPTLAARAAEINPDVKIVPVVGDVRLALGLGLFDEVDIVLGGLDNREARMFVNQACYKTSTPWIDGAIEGLMGVARVFDPPRTACYECTMHEHEYEQMAKRKTCALLTRDEMIDGKVPTTSTSASVIAAIQVQEAVKLMHSDRFETAPDFGGKGFQFVGLTHDSYIVDYPPKPDCMAHDTYDLEQAEWVDARSTFAQLLATAEEKLGPGAIIELEQEILLSAKCGGCGAEETFNAPVDSLDQGAGMCPDCGQEWRLDFTHAIGPESALLELTPVEIGLPAAEIITGRLALDRVFLRAYDSDGAIAQLESATRATK